MNRETLKKYAPGLIVGGALLLSAILVLTAPETKRTPGERVAPAVVIEPIERTDYKRLVDAYGTTMPAREVAIAPQVSGRIVDVSPRLVEGGIVTEGEVLFRIETADYELAVQRARADLDQARADLALEQGRQVVAEREWALFGNNEVAGQGSDRALALRKPQLEQAQARIAAAESELRRAELDLDRTQVKAPLTALVTSESLDIGHIVSAGTPVANLVGVGEFWVRASVPLSALAALQERGGEHADVRVSLELAFGREAVREGRFLRSLGRLDPNSRMAGILIAVDDPLGLKSGPRIPLSSYVRVQLAAGIIPDSVRIPRAGLRANSTVWVVGADNRLQVREVEVLWRAESEIAVRDVFREDERLIVSNLNDPLPGIDVRPQLASSSETVRDGASLRD